MIFLHIVFGMIAFIGALALGVSFRSDFRQLSTAKKAAIILSYVGSIGSTFLGFLSATFNPVFLIVTMVLVIGLTFILFKSADETEGSSE